MFAYVRPVAKKTNLTMTIEVKNIVIALIAEAGLYSVSVVE